MAVTTSSVGNFLAAAASDDEQQSSFLVSMRVSSYFYYRAVVKVGAVMGAATILIAHLKRQWRHAVVNFCVQQPLLYSRSIPTTTIKVIINWAKKKIEKGGKVKSNKYQ